MSFLGPLGPAVRGRCCVHTPVVGKPCRGAGGTLPHLTVSLRRTWPGPSATMPVSSSPTSLFMVSWGPSFSSTSSGACALLVNNPWAPRALALMGALMRGPQEERLRGPHFLPRPLIRGCTHFTPHPPWAARGREGGSVPTDSPGPVETSMPGSCAEPSSLPGSWRATGLCGSRR